MDKFLKLLIIFTLFSTHSIFAAENSDISDLDGDITSKNTLNHLENKRIIPVINHTESFEKSENDGLNTQSFTSEDDPNIIVD